ncbi:hypothetical protein AUJ14_02365 [Candidatus Micrarchaeota archaeon CG1_02_55_22]|nr:MAG: hypothetical protein AUJ14_02365 [Candidatus Micrarchaeota archaeon CG1_02_55_22]
MVPRLKLLSPSELLRLLEKLGFKPVHQKGSHLRLVHSDGRKTTIPIHSGQDIGPGLLNKIIKQDLKLTREEFEKLLAG